MPAIQTPVLVVPPSLDVAATVPLELFTRHYSITFTRSSITFELKREGSIPYVSVPGIAEYTHDPKWPTFDNTPGFAVSIGSFTFAALFDTGSQSYVNLKPSTAKTIELTEYPKAEMIYDNGDYIQLYHVPLHLHGVGVFQMKEEYSKPVT